MLCSTIKIVPLPYSVDIEFGPSHGFHHFVDATQRDAPHRNSAGTPPELWTFVLAETYNMVLIKLIKLQWLGHRVVKKLWRYVKSFRWNRNVTDRQTDRPTNRIAISISRAVRRWLWQALALPTFCDVLIERKTLAVRCGAMRYRTRYVVNCDGNHAYHMYHCIWHGHDH